MYMCNEKNNEKYLMKNQKSVVDPKTFGSVDINGTIEILYVNSPEYSHKIIEKTSNYATNSDSGSFFFLLFTGLILTAIAYGIGIVYIAKFDGLNILLLFGVALVLTAIYVLILKLIPNKEESNQNMVVYDPSQSV